MLESFEICSKVSNNLQTFETKFAQIVLIAKQLAYSMFFLYSIDISSVLSPGPHMVLNNAMFHLRSALLHGLDFVCIYVSSGDVLLSNGRSLHFVHLSELDQVFCVFVCGLMIAWVVSLPPNLAL